MRFIRVRLSRIKDFYYYRKTNISLLQGWLALAIVVSTAGYSAVSTDLLIRKTFGGVLPSSSFVIQTFIRRYQAQTHDAGTHSRDEIRNETLTRRVYSDNRLATLCLRTTSRASKRCKIGW